MKKILAPLVLLSVGFGALAACDDDVSIGVEPSHSSEGPPLKGDAGLAEDATLAPTPVDAAPDASAPVDPGEAGADGAPIPRRLLVTAVDFAGGTSELVAMNLVQRVAEGRFTAASTDSVTVARGTDLFFLQRDNDRVSRMDPRAPWQPVGTWSVKLGDAPDGGPAAANPTAAIVVAGAKAYVLRGNRNAIAILDTAFEGDGGAPTGTIDLTSFRQAADTDGMIDVGDAVFLPARRLLYVTLQHIDRSTIVAPDFRLRCRATKSQLVAIDVDSDTVVDLNGAAAGRAVDLVGTNPVGLAYDPAGDRLLVANAGCSEATRADGGDAASAQVWRGRFVEEVSLFSLDHRTLLDLTTLGYPSRFVLVDDRRALLTLFDEVTFASTTYVWDPTRPALGRAIAAPMAYFWDGDDSLIGLRTQRADGGAIDRVFAVSMRLADGLVTDLAEVPLTKKSAFIQGNMLFPAAP